jgi:ribosomal protein S18 acetylase RimI-like enzyme
VKAPSLAFRPFEAQDLWVLVPWLSGSGLGVPPEIREENLGQRLANDPRICCQAAIDKRGRVVGFLRLDSAPDRAAEVTLIVAPDERRRGVGAALLRRAVELAREASWRRLWAVIRLDNHVARHMFERAGFEEQGRPLPGHVHLIRIVHRGSRSVPPLEIPL